MRRGLARAHVFAMPGQSTRITLMAGLGEK